MKTRQWSSQYANIFKDRSVVQAYKFRPTYNQEAFDIIIKLLDPAKSRRVLDAGCGTGFVARELVRYVSQIDAVDFSREAIDEGKRLPGGDDPRLRWVHSSIEEATLFPPYDLITAGSSLHWMDWPAVMAKFNRNLKVGGYLALLENIIQQPPWGEEMRPLLMHYSLNKDFRPYDNMTIVKELEKRDLFTTVGNKETAATRFRQPVDDYVESFHARNGFSREKMSAKEAGEFDRRLKEIVLSFCSDGLVELTIRSRVIWGFPKG